MHTIKAINGIGPGAGKGARALAEERSIRAAKRAREARLARADFEVFADALDLTTATLENVMAHYGAQMPKGDQRSREGTIQFNRALLRERVS
jgi:hypothetical protein